MLENFDKSLAISDKFEPNVKESKRYHWANNFNDGVKLFNKAAQAGGSDSANIIFNESITKFKNAIACEPDSVDTYTNLAFCYLNIGKNDEAIDVFKNQVDVFKKKYNLDNFTADPSNDISKVIKKEQTAKTLSDAYTEIGDLYVRKASQLGSEKGLEYYNKAIDMVKEGRKYFPNNSDLLQILSNAYIGANKLDEAKEAFKEGVEKEPENKFYRYNYGSLLLNAGEFSEAEVQLKKAIELDPEYENALYNLAVTYVKWGAKMREESEAQENPSDEYKSKFEAALPLLEKYLTIKEDEGAVWDLLGKVYANLGMSDKSKEAFEKADMYK